ncbi:MAG TPA: hypothetical protein VHK65_10165 [Candidatus Dormibacteraeota bacterium]|nr:hypothetical protein [Candidatus Dormibacteraeota bacterium]
MNAPTAMWKVVLLGIIAALLIALGAGMSLLPDPSNSVAAYQQATPCTAANVLSDNCYSVVPVTVVTASANHLRKGGPEEHVVVQAPSGPSEIVLPWQSEQDQVLLAGATGTVDVYRGAPVLLAVGGYQFATLQNPVVATAQTRWLGWIFLGLGLAFGGAVVLTLVARRRRAFVPVPSSDALRQAIVQLPPDADPQIVEKMNEIQQRLATMQVQQQRGQITRGQTIGIVIGCAVAVVGALLLRGLH